MPDSPLPRGVEEIRAILQSPRSAPTSPTSNGRPSNPPSPTKSSLSRSKSTRLDRFHDGIDSVTGPRRTLNKLSITLPIQPVIVPSPPATISPSSTNVLSATTEREDDAVTAAEASDAHFLTALAAQERRVLDIREDLHRAEEALTRLKLEWTTREAHKKRQDLRRAQRMQKLSVSATPSAGSPYDRDSTPVAISPMEVALSAAPAAWPDVEKRKARFTQSTSQRAPQRTVFSGHRHVRALSLLSPDKSHVERFADFAQSAPSSAHHEGVEATARPSSAPRATTSLDLSADLRGPTDGRIDLALPSEAIMRHGRQMASDLRDGLMTFLEDLRQVTVGDDGVKTAHSRAQSQMQAHHRTRPAEPTLWPTNSNKPRGIATNRQSKKNPVFCGASDGCLGTRISP